MAKKSFKSLLQSSRKYVLFALVNLVFFLVPLTCNFYVDNVKIEDTAQKIANVASSTEKEQNCVAVNLRSSEAWESDSSANHFGVDVIKYNGLFVNSLQLTNGLLSDGLSFSYNDVDLNGINYVLSSGIYSNHQGKRGTLFDVYQVYLYSTDSNTDYHGCRNFCYVTERTAQKIMAINPEIKSYDEVINKVLTVKYKDIVQTWNIGNIVLDQEEFYEQMSNIYGDFILAYTHLPGDLGHNVDLTAYFGSNTYLNMNKMESLFSLENPTYEIYRGNLDKADASTLDEIDSFLNNFSYNETMNAVYYIEVGVIVAINSLCTWFYLRRRDDLKLVALLGTMMGSLIVAYVPFWIVYKATSNIRFLSYMGVLGMVIVFGVSAVVTVALWLLRKKEAK